MSGLPEHLDPWRAVDQNYSLEGSLPVAELGRLVELLMDDQGTVEFHIEFYRGDQRRGCVRGRVKTKVKVRCQRCLGAIDLELQGAFALALVEGLDEAAGLPDEYEPLQMTDGLVDPREMIEDELLLALPQIPVHEADEACVIDERFTRGESQTDPQAQADPQAENPFQVLEQLKKNLH